jgi:hypothetical protein
MIRRITFVLIDAALCTLCSAQDRSAISITPHVVDSRYCRDPDGSVTLRLNLQLKYQNGSSSAILLPRFLRASGYELFADRVHLDAHKSEYRASYKRAAVLDTTKLASDQPDTNLFDVIEPLGTLGSRMVDPSIPVRSRQGRAPLAGRDVYVVIDIDHWPDKITTGRRLQKLWRSHGTLLIDKMETDALSIHIDQDPDTQACRDRVD